LCTVLDAKCCPTVWDNLMRTETEFLKNNTKWVKELCTNGTIRSVAIATGVFRWGLVKDCSAGSLATTRRAGSQDVLLLSPRGAVDPAAEGRDVRAEPAGPQPTAVAVVPSLS